MVGDGVTAGTYTSRYRQSSLDLDTSLIEYQHGGSGWRQLGLYSVAESMEGFQEAAGWGGRQRLFPVGGAAYGMPRNACHFCRRNPCTLPV